MARVKVIGEFASASQAIIVEMHLKDSLKADRTIQVGPVEDMTSVPVYCDELAQATIEAALDGLGAENVIVEVS